MNLNYILILFVSIVVIFGFTEYSNTYNYVLAILLFILTLNLIYKKIYKIGNTNEDNTIDLTDIYPDTTKEEGENGITVYADYSNSKDNKFNPMFFNPINAKKLSPTNSVHLVIPGLLPASDKKWIDFNENQIFCDKFNFLQN